MLAPCDALLLRFAKLASENAIILLFVMSNFSGNLKVMSLVLAFLMALFVLWIKSTVAFEMQEPITQLSKAISGLVCEDIQFNWPTVCLREETCSDERGLSLFPSFDEGISSIDWMYGLVCRMISDLCSSM